MSHLHITYVCCCPSGLNFRENFLHTEMPKIFTVYMNHFPGFRFPLGNFSCCLEAQTFLACADLRDHLFLIMLSPF